TIPLGVLVGGLTAGFPIEMVGINTNPIAVISLAIAFGMWKWERILITAFIWLGRLIVTVSIIGLALGLTAQLTGFEVFEGMTPLSQVFLIIG
ncbi:ethanolamine utilization protein EutH, partial [Pseudomonas aeruginosa]|nr:ethanolamine utilization protein EutH [Pseudomonas aeruginosa]